MYTSRFRREIEIRTSPEKRRNSPVGEGHALEELVQGGFDAQLLRVPVIRASDESLEGEARQCSDRQPGAGLLVGHRHSELVLIVLCLGLEVRHHEVAGVYRFARIPTAAFPLTAMKTALAWRARHHHRRFSVYQLGLHPASLFCDTHTRTHISSRSVYIYEPLDEGLSRAKIRMNAVGRSGAIWAERFSSARAFETTRKGYSFLAKYSSFFYLFFFWLRKSRNY